MTKDIRKRNKQVRILKEELEQNKKTYESNVNLLQKRIELHTANLEEFEIDKRDYDLNKKALQIELSKCSVANPMMVYHQDLEWQKTFKELKQLEHDKNERKWKTAQKQFEDRKSNTDLRINQEKIMEQQKRIEERNPQIENQLKNLGVKLDDGEQKQDYIG